ncbi:MAG: hypothetical protein HC887_05930 [Desulfobacteraceae bacterium]|nr:hypothetical protein [Desulfobacteraceae bacterium]
MAKHQKRKQMPPPRTISQVSSERTKEKMLEAISPSTGAAGLDKIIKGSKVWRLAEMFRKFFYFRLLAKFPLLQKSALTLSKEGFKVFYPKQKAI